MIIKKYIFALVSVSLYVCNFLCVYLFCWCILFFNFLHFFIMCGNNYIVLLSEIQVNGGLFFVK